MFTDENTSKDLIMDLNIPFKIYALLLFLIFIYIIFKYFFSSEEIFEFIEKSKKSSLKLFSDEVEKLKLLTQLNTKINRDYLDNSKYYNKIGYSKIYGNHLEKEKDKECLNGKKNNKINNNKKEEKKNIFIKKIKKVGFSNNIIYENDCSEENDNKVQ